MRWHDEVAGFGVLDHPSLDVAALRGVVLDSVYCVAHQFHDATGTRRGTLKITRATTEQSRLAPNELAGVAGNIPGKRQAGGPSASVTFSVRAVPDLLRQLTEMESPG